MSHKQMNWLVPTVTLTIDQIRQLQEKFNYSPGCIEYWAIPVPSVSALHSFRHQEVGHEHYS